MRILRLKGGMSLSERRVEREDLFPRLSQLLIIILYYYPEHDLLPFVPYSPIFLTLSLAQYYFLA